MFGEGLDLAGGGGCGCLESPATGAFWPAAVFVLDSQRDLR